MKKKPKIALFLLAWVALAAGAQSRSPIDLVLLLDTSASMSGSYYDVGDYLTGPFLREFLRIGDTFHLISFSGAPKTELSRRIEGQGDVQTIIGRMLLMYPLQPSSDIAAALGYTERYISALPAERRKQVVLITDGVQDGAADLEELIAGASGRLKNSGTDFRFIRVPGQIPKAARAAPVPGLPEAAAAQASPPPVQSPAQATAVQPPAQPPVAVPPAVPPPARTQPAQTLDRTAAAASQPIPAQATQPPVPAQTSTTAPQPVQPPAAVPPTARTQPAQTPDRTAASPASQPIPAQAAQPPVPAQTSTTAPQPAQAPAAVPPPARTQPAQTLDRTAAVQPPVTPPVAENITTPESRRQAGGGFALPANFLFIGLGLLATIILALIVFLMLRRFHSSPGHVIAAASGTGPSPYAAETAAHDTARIKQNADMLSGYATDQRRGSIPPPSITYTEDSPVPEGGPLMLRFFVADQNTAIGRRNIHFVKAGFTFTIGGGRSDFLIFLVPIPPHIAEIRYDGRTCTFYPRRPEFFPDIGSQPVPDCLGKTIRVISKTGYELYIRVEKYENPLTALNRLLASITVPGVPEADSGKKDV
jgi:hypothetical protein